MIVRTPKLIIELDGLIYKRFLDAINDARKALMEERTQLEKDPTILAWSRTGGWGSATSNMNGEVYSMVNSLLFVY